MKKIKAAVSMRVSKEDTYGEIRDSISDDLVVFLERQQIWPILIPNSYSFSVDRVSDADFLLISGGNDIVTEIKPSSSSHSKKVFLRNNLEMELIEHFISVSKPIFGICHGLQLINHYFKGTLTHLTSGKHVASEHMVKFDLSSEELFLKYDKMLVNSFHNMIIDKLGKDMSVFARDAEENVEGIWSKDKKIMACMWHPERFFSSREATEFNENILTKFLEKFI